MDVQEVGYNPYQLFETLDTCFQPLAEKKGLEYPSDSDSKIDLVHFELSDNSPLIGKTTATARLRDDYSALLVAIQRGNDYIKPDGAVPFCAHDVLWIVGDARRLEQLK